VRLGCNDQRIKPGKPVLPLVNRESSIVNGQTFGILDCDWRVSMIMGERGQARLPDCKLG
jgi:hypothetical protein